MKPSDEDHQTLHARDINPFMPTVAFNICCPRDAVSRTANVERNGGQKWVKEVLFKSDQTTKHIRVYVSPWAKPCIWKMLL